MSDIFVKWVKLNDAANSFKSYATTLERYASQVESVRSRLRLSDEISQSVKATLAKDVANIQALSKNMRSYSSSLAMISEIYRTTEEANIDR